MLEYTIKVRRQHETAWVESGFRLVATPALVTGNKIKKPRMGNWHLEANKPASKGRMVAPSAALLARAASLMYFSGPAPGLVRGTSGMKLGTRFCRLWQVETPPGLATYAYLAEVAPDLLALSYLSASLGEEAYAGLELHLVKVDLGSHASPAAEGTVLLRTLARWGALAAALPEANGGTLPSERID